MNAVEHRGGEGAEPYAAGEPKPQNARAKKAPAPVAEGAPAPGGVQLDNMAGLALAKRAAVEVRSRCVK